MKIEGNYRNRENIRFLLTIKWQLGNYIQYYNIYSNVLERNEIFFKTYMYKNYICKSKGLHLQSPLLLPSLDNLRIVASIK